MLYIFVVVQLLSCVWRFVTTDCRTPGSSVPHCLLKFMSVEPGVLSNQLILCQPLLFLPSNFLSIRVLSNESALWIRWPKYWSFSFSISPSNEYSELISFRIGWFDFLAIQKSLKSLLQHHNLKVSILWHSFLHGLTLISVHDYCKTMALIIWTFVGKVMSLLFNTLFGFVIAFFQRSKHLLISWLQSLSTEILEAKKIKSVTVSTFPVSICHEVMGPDAVILVFLNVEFQVSFFTLLFHPHQEAFYFLFSFCR